MKLLIGLLLASATPLASAAMAPMEQIGPQPRPVGAGYAQVVHVSPDGENRSIAAVVASIGDASPQKRYAVLCAAGTYKESRITLKPYVDLYGGFPAGGGDWKTRDVFVNRTILDGQKNGPVVIGADHARVDGFVVTGGEHNAMGAGIFCDGVSPTLVNNIITANHTTKPQIREGLGKQIANEGAGIALLNGSHAYVANNLICDNSTDIGAGAGITVRGNVKAKILRNAFCNNTAGVKDNARFHNKEGSRSSPGAAIAVNDHSSPQISFNLIVLGQAVYRNDAGGIWVEGNSMPLISYNWIAGNTAYDDGGGIYVMGDLYYDDSGERHDFAPDGPATIEDNLIAGNNSVDGAPGGIRISRFGRADLRRNRIIANPTGGAYGAEGGVICVMEDNIIEHNDHSPPPFRLTADITDRKFDPDRYVTEITTAKDLAATDLAGAAACVGPQWSVIRDAKANKLILWGKITDEAATVKILDDYLPEDDGHPNSNQKKRR